MNELVHVEVGAHADRVAVLTLADGERRNAITPAMNDQLLSAFDDLESDPGVGCVVLTGAGPSFCAGADLQHLGASATEDGLRLIYQGFMRVAASPLPTVAAVNGHAVGAGMNLALACDIRLAGQSARFDTRFLKLGIHPGGGHTYLMQHIIGTQATLATVLFGETLDGDQAAQRGLVWRCVADDELLPTALSMAARVASFAPDLVRRTKASIGATAHLASHQDAMSLELDAQLWSMHQPEFVQSLAALQRSISSAQ